jgi:hypothetical protein
VKRSPRRMMMMIRMVSNDWMALRSVGFFLVDVMSMPFFLRRRSDATEHYLFVCTARPSRVFRVKETQPFVYLRLI